MSYTKVQFIGYAINTGPKWSEGKQEYVGVLKDDSNPQSAANQDGTRDIDARFKLLEKVLNAVEPEVEHDNTTLKLFVLPEFFFRGPLGGYPLMNQEYFNSSARRLVGDPKFKNWFFILGTTVFFWTADTKPNYQYINYSLCIPGGFENNEAKAIGLSHIVQKEMKSGIDFIEEVNARQGLVHERTDVLAAIKSIGQRTETSTQPYEGTSIVKLQSINNQDITIGVEVCLDHACQRLKQSQLLDPTPILIQVIPSCGMWIIKEFIVATKYVFNCDGLNDTNPLPMEEITWIDGGTSLFGPPQAHTTLYDVAGKVKEPTGILSIMENVSNIFPYPNGTDAGQVHIYESLDL